MKNSPRLVQLLEQFPGFDVPTSYAPVGGPLHSKIYFSNFYGQVFPKEKIDVDLHFVVFNENGLEIGSGSEFVQADGAVQISLDAFANGRGDGLVAVMAVPRTDIRTLETEQIRIKKSVGTGFYVTWNDDQGHFDTHHEWTTISKSTIPREDYYVPLVHDSKRPSEWKIILMNSVCDVSQEKMALPTLACFGKDRQLLGEKSIAGLPNLSTRVVSLAEEFPQLPAWKEQHGMIVVKVTSENLSQPLTFEVHGSGDFHIHHTD